MGFFGIIRLFFSVPLYIQKASLERTLQVTEQVLGQHGIASNAAEVLLQAGLAAAMRLSKQSEDKAQ